MLTLKQREEKRVKRKQAVRQPSFKWLINLRLIAGILTFLSAGYLLFEFRNVIIEIKWLLLSASIYCLPVVLFCGRSRYYIMYYWFLAAGVFFFLNSVFAQKKVFVINRPIEYKLYRRSRSGPSAEITYHRVSLSVFCDNDSTLAKANYAELILSKGLFGIEIVRDSKAIP